MAGCPKRPRNGSRMKAKSAQGALKGDKPKGTNRTQMRIFADSCRFLSSPRKRSIWEVQIFAETLLFEKLLFLSKGVEGGSCREEGNSSNRRFQIAIPPIIFTGKSRGREARVPEPGPPLKMFGGKITNTNDFAYFSRKSCVPGGPENFEEKCPPAGTRTKI